MLKRKSSPQGTTAVTFVLPASAGPASVVGEFNDWDPMAHPLKKRSNGTRSVTIDLRSGHTYPFRYLGEGGNFFDEPDADDIVPNGYGSTHSIVTP